MFSLQDLINDDKRSSLIAVANDLKSARRTEEAWTRLTSEQAKVTLSKQLLYSLKYSCLFATAIIKGFYFRWQLPTIHLIVSSILRLNYQQVILLYYQF